MQFGVAIKRLAIGDATKTLGMGGYIYKKEKTTSRTDVESQLVFKNKDGVETMCDVMTNGEFAEYSTPMAQVLKPELLTQIVHGDWTVMKVAEAEEARTNPKIW